MLRPMDLHATAEQESLRASFRAWLMEHLPWPYGVGLPPRFDDLAETVAFGRRWQAELAADGWVGVTWPEEYGGRGLGALENYVVIEELARAGPPSSSVASASTWSGPPCWPTARDEQKERFLPQILSAAELWCQLFSEPDAGSDLASLTTRAVPVEGGYRVTGRKVWTSYAQFADWGLCLTRSDPTRRSASRASPRSSSTCTPRASYVHPLVQSTGEAEFNEVELDDVFVPADRAVGAEGEGWARRRLDAGPRARHQPPPARDPHPAHRGAAPPGRGERQLRRLAPAPVAGPGGHRGPALPAPQLALADPPVQGRGARPRGQRAQALLERDVQAAPPDRARRPGAGLAPVGGRGGQPGRRRVAAFVAVLPGVLHLRRAPTRSSGRWWASGCWGSPGLSVRRGGGGGDRMGDREDG